MLDYNALNIYTDGSAPKNPGNGGIGFVFVFPDFLERDPSVKEFCPPGYKGVTNNQMELKACIVALEEASKLKDLRKIQRIVVHTDSMYIVDNYKNAIWKWPGQKWRSVDGTPILNVELWKELVRNITKVRRPMSIEHVKGHSRDVHNRAADKLAKKSAKNPQYRLSLISVVRRKKTTQKTERGVVEMLGQKITIRIVGSEYLNKQKEYRFRYEVVSKKSPFCGKLDFIYYQKPLRAGHTFFVRLNDEQTYPQIVKVFREIK